MKLKSYIFASFTLILVFLVYGFSVVKKKKFLDHFVTYKSDTLTVSSAEYADIYDNANTSLSLKGNTIDTMFNEVYELEGGEDIREFSPRGWETGPLAYQKIKLDMGCYLLIIRAGGEYWNSRYHACLYNDGNKRVTSTLPVAESFGDTGFYYTCKSFFQKEDNRWSIYTHHTYFEPFDFDKYGMDSVQIKNVDVLSTIEQKEDHFYFLEKSRAEKTSWK